MADVTIRSFRVVLGAFALVIIGLILWVDLATDIWSKYVIISSLAGGLVTFVLTTLILERVIARADHERWEPVTRLALGDLRRRLAGDATVGEVHRLPDPEPFDIPDDTATDAVLKAAHRERETLIESLARWSAFLSSSADVIDIMDGIAHVALRLDEIDRHVRGLRATPADSAARRTVLDALRAEIAAYHAAADNLLGKIDLALQTHTQRERTAAE